MSAERAGSSEPPRIEAFGDAAVLVTFGASPDEASNRRAHALAGAVESLRHDDRRYGRAVPAQASVLVPFDPLAVSAAEARATLGSLAAAAARDSAAEDAAAEDAAAEPLARLLVEIPVRYGGVDGPDLAPVAELLGLRPGDVVELHAGSEYGVRFLGFAPGFAYLGPLVPELEVSRLATPRERVPAGSVGIAGDGTAVYPFELPGGWRLLGRTEAPMWDVRRDPPALLAPGARVRFVPLR